MNKETVWRMVAWSPLLHSAVLILGTFLCFLIAYCRGDVSIYLPYISETGAMVPEMCLFSAFLIFACFVGVVAMFYRFMLLSYMINESEHLLCKINIIGFLCGLASMTGLGGVAAFPMSTLLYVHVFIAGIHFTFATLYTFVQTFISFKMKPPYHNKALNKIRLAVSLFLIPSAILVTILMPLGHFKWMKIHPDRSEATKTPADQLFGIVFTGSLCEWLWYSAWLFYFSSFMWENIKFELVTLVKPKDLKKESEVYANGNISAVC